MLCHLLGSPKYTLNITISYGWYSLLLPPDFLLVVGLGTAMNIGGLSYD